MELDGVSSSLSSAPGVSRATALLIDGDIHGFIVPSGQDIEGILDHTAKLQPYYAIPSKVHQLDEFPTTANGKIDKKILRVLAAEAEMDQKRPDSPSRRPANAAPWLKPGRSRCHRQSRL